MLFKSGFPEEQETEAAVHIGIKTGQQKIGKNIVWSDESLSFCCNILMIGSQCAVNSNGFHI